MFSHTRQTISKRCTQSSVRSIQTPISTCRILLCMAAKVIIEGVEKCKSGGFGCHRIIVLLHLPVIANITSEGTSCNRIQSQLTFPAFANSFKQCKIKKIGSFRCGPQKMRLDITSRVSVMIMVWVDLPGVVVGLGFCRRCPNAAKRSLVGTALGYRHINTVA
jgi:hypothetical protein